MFIGFISNLFCLAHNVINSKLNDLKQFDIKIKLGILAYRKCSNKLKQ